MHGKGGSVFNKQNQQFDFIAYHIVVMVLSSIRRNGLEKTLEDLRKNCRGWSNSNEEVYQDVLAVIDEVSTKHEEHTKRNKKQ